MRAFIDPASFVEYSMSDQQDQQKDHVADAIAAVALITIAVLSAVFWVSGQG